MLLQITNYISNLFNLIRITNGDLQKIYKPNLEISLRFNLQGLQIWRKYLLDLYMTLLCTHETNPC